jgi:hypothetical protein
MIPGAPCPVDERDDVVSLQVERTCRAVSALTWTRDVKGVQVVFQDQTIEVKVSERLTGGGTKVTEESGFDVIQSQGFFEKRVPTKVDHTIAREV